MTPYHKRLNPLIQRMAEDMKLRNLSPRTIDAYTWHVDKFCKHFGKQPDQLGPEEIRQYQLYLVEQKKASWSSFNLFPGKTPDVPLASTTIQKACKQAAATARIHKQVTPHTLRHSYATGLLEAGVDLLTIGRLLGHKSFTTTLIYLHVRRPHLERAPSPIDWLPIRQCPKWVDPNSRADNHPDQQHNNPPPSDPTTGAE